jgi:hypothetical protein
VKNWGGRSRPTRARVPLLRADLKDHARAGDLAERTILGADNMGVGASVPDRTVAVTLDQAGDGRNLG